MSFRVEKDVIGTLENSQFRSSRGDGNRSSSHGFSDLARGSMAG
jgi:hypothetical protein